MDFPNQCGAAAVGDKTNIENLNPSALLCMFLHIYYFQYVCKHRSWANVIKVKISD